MRKLENKESVNEIYFEKAITPFCPLGDDYYIAKISVWFVPKEFYPEYCELTAEIEKLSTRPLTIEQLCETVFSIVKQYEPGNLDVEIEAKSEKHFPVTVTKHLYN